MNRFSISLCATNDKEEKEGTKKGKKNFDFWLDIKQELSVEIKNKVSCMLWAWKSIISASMVFLPMFDRLQLASALIPWPWSLSRLLVCTGSGTKSFIKANRKITRDKNGEKILCDKNKFRLKRTDPEVFILAYQLFSLGWLSYGKTPNKQSQSSNVYMFNLDRNLIWRFCEHKHIKINSINTQDYSHFTSHKAHY